MNIATTTATFVNENADWFAEWAGVTPDRLRSITNSWLSTAAIGTVDPAIISFLRHVSAQIRSSQDSDAQLYGDWTAEAANTLTESLNPQPQRQQEVVPRPANAKAPVAQPFGGTPIPAVNAEGFVPDVSEEVEGPVAVRERPDGWEYRPVIDPDGIEAVNSPEEDD